MQPHNADTHDTGHDAHSDTPATHATTSRDTSHPDVLTVAQAAQMLGVSPCSIQRRCQKGTLRAQRIESEFGEQWEIDRAEVEQAATQAATSPRREPRQDDAIAATQGTPQARHVAPLTHQGAEDIRAPIPANSDQRAPDYAARYVAQIEAENAFLRAQVEEGNRNAAELRAALREALKAQPRQLEAPALSPQIAQGRAQTADPTNTATQSGEAVKSPQSAKGAAPTKEPRPLWKLILGLK